MKESIFYEKLKDDKIKCTLCPNLCTIAVDKTGFCGVIKNVNGELFNLVYNKISSEAIDPIEKKPLYHFYPGSSVYSIGTIGCNMRCKHCQNWQIAHTGVDESSAYLKTLKPYQLIDKAKTRQCRGVAFTYNEPTIWFEYVLECAEKAKENGLYTVFVTSGWINPKPLEMLSQYIDAFSLDIKGFTDDFYKKIANKNTFKPVLDNASYIKSKGLHLEIVTNIIPTYNDDFDQIDKLSKWIAENLGTDTPLHLTAFHPAYKLTEQSRTKIETLEGDYKIAKNNGLEYVYLGNVISDEGSTTICPECGYELIQRGGFFGIKNNIKDGHCPKCRHRLTSIIDD